MVQTAIRSIYRKKKKEVTCFRFVLALEKHDGMSNEHHHLMQVPIKHLKYMALPWKFLKYRKIGRKLNFISYQAKSRTANNCTLQVLKNVERGFKIMYIDNNLHIEWLNVTQFTFLSRQIFFFFPFFGSGMSSKNISV